MKEGTTITKLVMFLLAACLAVYFAVYLFRGMTDPMTTAVAYAYTVNDSVEAEALIVRQEQVLAAGVGIADVSPGEGERVGAGQTVAVLYRDSQALERRGQIEQLMLEAELLQYATTQADPGSGTAELEDEVVRAAVLLRSDSAAGDFDRLEDQVLDLKRAVLKRDYTYGMGADTSRMSEISAQLRALQSRSAQDTSRVRAVVEGTFSAQVDGYEDITPDAAARLTPLDLDALLDRGVQSDERALGKIITANRWNLAINLPEEAAERLTLSKTTMVRFAGDFSRDVNMRVDSISKPQDGRCTVLLSTDRYLASTTLLRRQTVEVIFESDQGLRVPKDAVHILTETVTDKETGEEKRVSTTGVYVLVNGQAEFKQVQAMAEGTQFYVIKPLDTGKRMLRAGDQVIVRARGLYDGKVVQE